jgi:hypothetical protein
LVVGKNWEKSVVEKRFVIPGIGTGGVVSGKFRTFVEACGGQGKVVNIRHIPLRKISAASCEEKNVFFIFMSGFWW